MKKLLNTRFFRCFSIFVLSILALISFSFFGSGISTVNATEIKVETEIEDIYVLNATETFAQEIEVSYKGKNYIANEATLKLPDGNKVSLFQGETLLDSVGKYTITYYFTAEDGTVVCASDDFMVVDDKYAFTSSSGNTITKVQASTDPCLSNNDDKTYTGDSGVIVRLNSGSKFIYNQPIDLSGGAYGSLRSVVKIDPRPINISYNQETGTYDFNHTIAEQILVRLTDCYDPLNYVEIMIDVTKYVGSGSVYIKATHSGEATNYYGVRAYPTSEPLSWWFDREFYMDSERGIVFSEYGVYCPVNASQASKDSIEILYDSDRDRIYFACGTNTYFVLDVANEVMYGNSAFKGFKADEIILSVVGSNYKAADPVRFDLFSIGGKEIESTEEMKAIDENPPKINIQMEKTDKYGVFAAVGENFTIPSATVFDYNYKGDLSVKVYRNYGKPTQINVSVKDNAFLVGNLDNYTIVYTAKDAFGNETKQLLEVKGVNVPASLSITADKLDKLYLGEIVTLPAYTVFTLNKQDSVVVDVKAIADGQIFEVDTTTMQLPVTKTGTYTIVYTVQDNVSVAKFSYNVEVELRSDVVFVDNPFIQRQVLKGAFYKVEQVYAYVKDSSGNFTPKKADLMVAFDGDDNFTRVEDLNKCVISGNQTVAIKFVYDGVESQTTTAEIIDVGYTTVSQLQFDKYFQGNFIAGTILNNGQETGSITYTSNVTKGSNTLRFVNLVNYKVFGLAFNAPKSKDNFEKINVRFVNPKNPTDNITLTVEKTLENAVVSYEGGLRKSTNVAFGSSSNIDINFEYDRRRIVINGAILEFYKTLDCDLAYLEIELVGIDGDSAITIAEVGNVPFNRFLTADASKPEVWIQKSLGRYNPNEEITIYSPIFSDILSNVDYSTIKICVKDGKGNFIRTINEILLDGRQELKDSYVIKPVEYGEYVVQYEAKDCVGISTGIYQYKFSIADNVAPEINLNKLNEDSIVTVGAKKRISVKYSVSDNCDDEKDLLVQINVLRHKDYSLIRDVGKSFTISERGLYTVYVYCVDTSGNSAIRSFYVDVR